MVKHSELEAARAARAAAKVGRQLSRPEALLGRGEDALKARERDHPKVHRTISSLLSCGNWNRDGTSFRPLA